MTERELLNRIMLAATDAGGRLFRNQAGKGWYGQARRISHPDSIEVYPGDVVIRNARQLQSGLVTGASDLIGWRVVTVTPEMVGRAVALFAAVEVKTPRVRLTTEQRRFLEAVRAAGGEAIEARAVEDLGWSGDSSLEPSGKSGINPYYHGEGPDDI